MKIGLYPGSFNPVHKGHISIIGKLLNDQIIDKIIIIPLNNHPHKNIAETLNKRIDMLKLYETENIIIENNSSIKYTYEIMDKYKNKYKDNDIYYIIGSDNLESIDRWKNAKEVLENKFIVIARPGYNASELITKKRLNGNNFIIIDSNYNISSTTIREKVKNSENVDDFIDQEIYNYIINNHLYTE